MKEKKIEFNEKKMNLVNKIHIALLQLRLKNFFYIKPIKTKEKLFED